MRLITMDAAERERRLRTFEANFGRDFGWFVERDARRIAELTGPKFEDMFWFSYEVTPLADDEPTRDALFTKTFWNGSDLVYRNRVTDEIAATAFPAGIPPTRDNPRIWMRGLYSSMSPTIVEHLVLWIRRWRRRA